MREHSDPLARLKMGDVGSGQEKQPSGIPPHEANRILREFKEKHYTEWIDYPLPALDGETPREAVRTKEDRGRVDLLLKKCENSEARSPAEEQFDFTGIRKKLGL